MSKRKPPQPSDRYFRFLTRLSRGGRSNMYGAVPYLAAAFGLDREAAFRVVCEWVDAQQATAAPGAPAPAASPPPPTSRQAQPPASGHPPAPEPKRGSKGESAGKPPGVRRKRPGVRRAA
jgi:hypothetical protein